MLSFIGGLLMFLREVFVATVAPAHRPAGTRNGERQPPVRLAARQPDFRVADAPGSRARRRPAIAAAAHPAAPFPGRPAAGGRQCRAVAAKAQRHRRIHRIGQRVVADTATGRWRPKRCPAIAPQRIDAIRCRPASSAVIGVRRPMARAFIGHWARSALKAGMHLGAQHARLRACGALARPAADRSARTGTRRSRSIPRS